MEEPFKLDIEKFVYGGYAIGHSDRANKKTYFVEGAIPKESILVKRVKKKKGVCFVGRRDFEIIQPESQYRKKAICQHFDRCGGCSFQHLPYESQVKAKEEILKELFPDMSLEQTICDENKNLYYRNKCEFTFGNASDTQAERVLTLGLHSPGSFLDILDLKECYLLPAKVWKILERARELAEETKLPAFNDRKNEGFWSTLTIRYSYTTEECLLVWRVKDITNSEFLQVNEKLKKEFNYIVGILAGDAPRGELKILSGINSIYERIGDLDFIYQAENFFQINICLLERVMNSICELVKFSEAEIIYDLFSGVGIIGIFVAKYLKKVRVIAAEADAVAVNMCAFNAELNKTENYYEAHLYNLYKGRWGTHFQNLNTEKKKSCVIVDPPRAGLSNKTIREISQIGSDSIVYMSCNPSTQKRDIELLKENGYELKSLRMIDMFPQTFHIESLALMQRTVN